MKKISDTTWIVIGMLGGLAGGLVFGPAMGEIKFLGDIFLRLIQMSICVLIAGAVIEAVGALKAQELGLLGGKTLLVFFITTIVASISGLVMVNILQPGIGIPAISGMEYKGASEVMSWGAAITEFFPKNIVDSMAKGSTVQIIAFSLVCGVALSLANNTPEGGRALEMVRSVNVVILGMMHLILKVAPIGVFALLGLVTGVVGIAVVIPLLKFLLSLLIAAIVTYLCMALGVCAYARISPFTFTRKLYRMGMIAFSTTSSAVALAVEMEDCEKRYGVDPSVTRLVLPLGMTLSSAGLALYLAVACVTMFQFFNLDASFSMQFRVVFMSTLATLGTASVPGGALVSLAIVFPTVGIPLEGIAILAGVDRFSDMIRTPMNVFCDVVAAVAVASSSHLLDRETFKNVA